MKPLTALFALSHKQNYCKFEDWVMPVLDKMLEEQKAQVKHYLCVSMSTSVIHVHYPM